MPSRSSAPAVSVADQVAGLLERIVRQSRRDAAGQLEPLGLTPAQLRLLRILHRLGGPTRMNVLATRLDVVPRSATSTVDSLQELGYVERAGDPTDRRATLVSLTDAGTQALDEARVRMRSRSAAAVEALSAPNQLELMRLLTLLAAPDPPAEDDHEN